MARKHGKGEPRKAAKVRVDTAILDPEVRTKIMTVLKVGAGKLDAARMAGISQKTIHKYFDRARRASQVPEADRTESEAYWAEFHREAEQALSEPKVYLLKIIHEAAQGGDWKAAAWALAKLYPLEFGDRNDSIRRQVEQGLEDMILAMRNHLSTEAYGELLEAMAVAGGYDRPRETAPSEADESLH